MKGIVGPQDPKDDFDIGHDMEAYAAARWARRNPDWRVSAGEVQFHVPANHFPFPAIGTIDRRTSRGSWRRVLEVKIARNQTDMEAWGDDLSGECPEDYAAQVLAQRLFVAAAQPSAKWLPTSHLLAIGPYWNERVYEIEYDPSVASWIIDECARFYRSLAGDTPPDLDDTPATYECLKALHPDIDPDGVVDIDPELAVDYLEAKAGEKAAKSAALGATNRLLAAMERAHYAKVGRTLSDAGDLVGGITVADRRNNGKGGVSLYAGRSVTPEMIRQLEGSTPQ
jgi:hypothetical protein